MKLPKIALSRYILCALISMGAVAAQSGGPWMGTWKLNLEKSKYSPGPGPAHRAGAAATRTARGAGPA